MNAITPKRENEQVKRRMVRYVHKPRNGIKCTKKQTFQKQGMDNLYHPTLSTATHFQNDMTSDFLHLLCGRNQMGDCSGRHLKA